ncbi:MAG: sensor domain-containing diguanylate cyclase [Desulfobulbaceae bacterium]|nr:sensor domain-containing diguanylate cyclase [Desulfobulbaceae bacterium]
MEFDKKSYQRIIDTLHDGLYFVDRDRRITYWNRSAEQISGFAAAEVEGRSCSDNILTHMDGEGNCLCLDKCPLAFTMEDGQPREAVVYMHHRDGHRVPVSVRTSALIDENGVIVGGVELFSDISGQGANELRVRELEKMALLDNLTQLANRNYLERELHSRFEEHKRLGAAFGLLFFDIDHFKKFNDTYGHDVGDEVLKCVANTLVSNSRPFDLYCRWGGEEFVGIIRNCTAAELAMIANRLRLLVANAYVMHQGEGLQVTISLGATMLQAGDSMESLLKRADTLMYESKRAGRNRVTLR